MILCCVRSPSAYPGDGAGRRTGPILLEALNDTITQLATPPGEGGLAVIRLSGPDSSALVEPLLRTATGMPVSLRARHATHGYLVSPGADTLDEVVVTLFEEGHSYTGEEMIEIGCHPGRVTVRRILNALTTRGARLAEPGAFSKRAFLNGRLDLTQAEAVSDLVRAKSDAAARSALRQLQGGLHDRISPVRERLMELLIYIEAAVDFPDDVPDIDEQRLTGDLRLAAEDLDRLLTRADIGRTVREGVRVALVGRPNVGKSSLLNAFLGRERAIVTPIPGTTRDVLEEYVTLKGVAFQLIDTAGLRHTVDDIEILGVERTRLSIRTCDICVLILDASEPLRPEDEHVLADIREITVPVVVALNKADLPTRLDATTAIALQPAAVVETSAVKPDGIQALSQALIEVVGLAGVAAEPEVLTNERHIGLLHEARKALQNAREAAEQGQYVDLLSIDIRHALEKLGEITGETVTPDLIDRIFSTFCLGK